MSSNYEAFFDNGSFAVVGHRAARNFPLLTFRGLRRLGKVVFPVDPSATEIDGQRAYADLAQLPQRVDAVVLEVPREETRYWVARAAEAGIRDVWIHMNRETPEALALAMEKGLNIRSGRCAVMYVARPFTYHSVHKWLVKGAHRY